MSEKKKKKKTTLFNFLLFFFPHPGLIQNETSQIPVCQERGTLPSPAGALGTHRDVVTAVLPVGTQVDASARRGDLTSSSAPLVGLGGLITPGHGACDNCS